MLYRITDVGIRDSDEPLYVIWVSAPTPYAASARARSILGLIWEVDAEDIIGLEFAPRSEFELECESVQPDSAGDQRLVEMGSINGRAVYHQQPTLFFVKPRDYARLAKAYLGE